MMLIAGLPAQVGTPHTAAAQSPDDSFAEDTSTTDIPEVDIAVGPVLRDHAGPIIASDHSEIDQSAVVADDVILEEEIVYVGRDERIYVLDTHQVDDNPLVKWVSPDGDWRSVDVGDFNNDGDMEIVAVGGGKNDGKLAVWDPVDKTGSPGLPTVNGIPWQLLHQRLIPGRPDIVKAGNFDPNIPGDEILYGFKMLDEIKPDDDDEFRTTIIKSGTPNPDGTNWVDHIKAKDDGNEWTYVESGISAMAGRMKLRCSMKTAARSTSSAWPTVSSEFWANPQVPTPIDLSSSAISSPADTMKSSLRAMKNSPAPRSSTINTIPAKQMN